jgi:heptosyltransferase-2
LNAGVPILNILLVKLDGIGDALLAVPALRAIRAAHPEADLTLVVRSPVEEIFKHAGLADRVIRAGFRQNSCDTRKGWLGYLAGSARNGMEACRFYQQHLAKRKYSLALNLRLDRDSYGGGYLVGRSAARQRVGIWEKATESKYTGNRFHDLLYTEAVHMEVARHEVENNLALVQAIGMRPTQTSLGFDVSLEDREKAQGILPFSERSRVVVMGVGANQRKRQWPQARYGELIALLAQKGFRCVLVGSEWDRTEVAGAGGMPGARNLCGRLGLREVYSLMEGCRLFVGNDSGPMHLAAAAGLPVVEISSYPKSAPAYGSNCPRRFGPWGVPNRILQPANPLSPCSGQCRSDRPHCITQISVEEAWCGIEELLEATS